MRRNILSQAVGIGTVADLDLPHDFLRRLTDRALRGSFYEHFRAVVTDSAATRTVSRPAPDAPTGPDPTESAASYARAAAWRPLSETTPFLPSFRSPSTDSPESARRRLLGEDAPSLPGAPLLAARRLVRKHLARDGLLPTLTRAMASIGPELLRSCDPSESLGAILADLGVPVDLLDFFDAGIERGRGLDIARSILERLAGGESAERVAKSLQRARMTPRPSLPGFRPTSESGTDEIGHVRLQATRAEHYAGPGDGGALDLVAETLRAFSNAHAIVAVSAVDKLALGTALGTSLAAGTAPSMSVLPQPLTLSQWAGDTAKGGGFVDGDRPVPAQLAPRFVSRGEYAERFLPGDDLAAAEVDRAHAARSPLIFQGGNLLVCDDLAARDRVLLVGEAEIERNRAMGLSREQVLEFFRAEFGAGSCHVLPAASYHIDQELSVRSMPGPDARTLAFVPDVAAAARNIVETALDAIRAAKHWPDTITDIALTHLRAARVREGLSVIWTRLAHDRGVASGWPIALAESLSAGPTDSGIGNIQRFLLALDHLTAEVFPPSEISDSNYAALLGTYGRRAEDRARIRLILSRLGWRIVPVPALPEDARGINPLNGIHTRSGYLMPAYGGLYAPLDRLAMGVFAAAMDGSVPVTLIPSGESQRREGALHCSVVLFYA